MLILLGFSFLSGLVTILAPCIWPLLPIVLSSSLAGGGGKKRPLGITIGVMGSFALFTLAISSLVAIFHFDPNVLRLVAVVVIFALGLTMLIPQLSKLFELAVGRLTGRLGGGQKTKSGFIGGLITGFTLGIIWSPCAGPILAAIATLAATGQVTWMVVAVTLSYVVGVGIPLFLFAYGGQQLILRAKGLNKYTGAIQRAFGIVMILASVLIYTNYDKELQLRLLDAFPKLGNILTGFETSDVVKDQLLALKGQEKSELAPKVNNLNLFNVNAKAPEFVGINNWLNTPGPITMESLKGKVVLIDFWTYTCINCIRTLPYVTSWYEKYKDQGFVVVGVHTPEFAFEKETRNVNASIKQFNINYPVAQDNDYKTWDAYQNQYWPAEYLVDAKGVVRRTHFGEGEYDKMEEAIKTLLTEAGKDVVDSPLTEMRDETPSGIGISPETYIGAERMQFEWPNGTVPEGERVFQTNFNIPANSFSFGGKWNVKSSFSSPSKGSTLTYNFRAKKVFLVMRPGAVAGKAKVTVDGVAANGQDVLNGEINITTDRLYELVDFSDKDVSQHTLKLEFTEGEVEVYAFTFG